MSLSQAAEVLGFRGQELWNMLRGAGITIHRVDWDDCRGSAISLRDLFRLRQAQMPRHPAMRASRLPPDLAPQMPLQAPPPQQRVEQGPWAGAQGSLEARELEDGDFDASEFGADMERLRDLVRDAQVRNEYLSVELQQLHTQMSGQARADTESNDQALQAVRNQTAETVADLRNQVRASGEALEEAAEALEAERAHNRELEKQVRDLRADLLKLSDSRAIDDLRESLHEEKEKAARIQHDLERSLSLQRRSLARLEREKQALAERLGVRDEIERNNQRYIDRLERRIDEMRKGPPRPSNG